MEILAIEGLTKNFYLHNLGKTIKSCRDIGFTLHEGEFIGIVGRSGAGKSSILKCINRTYLPLQGTIVYNSQAFGPIDLAQADERQMLQLRRYEIGYVAQFLNVMPRTTAKEHVMKEEKTSMLGIFHDLEFMEGVCDKVFNMSEGSFA